jgi:hypothetical protein
MKKLPICFLALLIFLVACTPYMYGVPQESWDRMSEPERIQAMQVYEREQQARRQATEQRAQREAIEEQARRQAAEERARHEAVERERAQARQAALERERHERIEAIHRGQGALGELIRVRLQGGMIRIGEHYHRYEPLTFTIADGETRKFGMADSQGREVDLTATYANGAFSLEGGRFPYDHSWGRGRLYTSTGISGAHELRDVDVFIEIRDRSSRIEREHQRLVISRDYEPPVRPTAPPAAERPPRPTAPAPPAAERPPRPTAPAPPAVERPPRSVEIILLSGEVSVRGQKQRLEKVSLRMADGESRQLTVKAGRENSIISLSYSKGELFIDGTPERGHDAVRVHFEKEWKNGKVYILNLKGKTPVEKLEIKVTGIAN